MLYEDELSRLKQKPRFIFITSTAPSPEKYSRDEASRKIITGRETGESLHYGIVHQVIKSVSGDFQTGH